MRTTTTPFIRRDMYAGQLHARADLYFADAPGQWELYLSVGDSVPVQYQGSLELMNSVLDAWTFARTAAGFEMAADLQPQATIN